MSRRLFLGAWVVTLALLLIAAPGALAAPPGQEPPPGETPTPVSGQVEAERLIVRALGTP